MSRTAKGYVIALVGITIWSTTPIFIGALIRDFGMPALVLSAWRNALVCVALVPVLLIFRPALLRLPRAHVRFFALYGLLLAVFNGVWMVSVSLNGAAVATVLGYSSPAFTAVLAWWLFKETLGLPKLLAVALSLLGCALVADALSPTVWQLNALGIITGLGAGVLFAGYNLFGKAAARRGDNVWTALLYSFGFAALFGFVLAAIAALPGAAPTAAALWPALSGWGWVLLLVLSFGPTLLGFAMYNASMGYLPASITSLLASTEPAMTAALAYFFLGERLTPLQLAGGGLILLAVVIVQLERRPPAAA